VYGQLVRRFYRSGAVARSRKASEVAGVSRETGEVLAREFSLAELKLITADAVTTDAIRIEAFEIARTKAGR
jgi:hypothetical protein